MRLADGLRLSPGRVAAFVGAGGKTSALQRATAELGDEVPLLATTTTRLGREQTGFGRHMIAATEGEWRQAVAAMATGAPLVVTGPLAASKWLGIDPGWIDRSLPALHDCGGVLLIEADGSRGRALKAPAEHEPVIPSSTDLVVVVAGLHAVDHPLSDEIAHRAAQLSVVTGLQAGDPITVGAMGALLTSDQGGLKGVPTGAEVRILLTHVQSDLKSQAAELAEICLQSAQIRAVLASDLRAEAPVASVNGRVAAVVLAAGGSSRMDRTKQLLVWRGKPLVRHAVDSASAAGLSPVVLVAGGDAKAVTAAIESANARLVTNPDWQAGQAGSLRLGLAAVSDAAEAVVFLLADMPLIQPTMIERLVHYHQATLAPIVAPEREGRFGNPVLFDRQTFSDLGSIEGDRGGRALFSDYKMHGVPAGDEAFLDIDRDEDWREFVSKYGE